MLPYKMKELRVKNGYTQHELAKILNVSIGAVGNWETGKRSPDYALLSKIADLFGTSVDYLIGREIDTDEPTPSKGVKIPVLGRVAAGIPIEAVEEILDYEEITPELASTGTFFALKIKGNSMEPMLMNGDVVIVKQQPDVESGDTAIVMVNGDEATCKRIVKQKQGISLVANNPAYEPIFFSNKEIADVPVRVLGKVVELRRSF